MSVIQTDAAINSGNSGGPLANSNGEVVGITSLKLVSNGVEGMGFAIPIETAINYAEKFIAGEKITQPYLGVSMLNIAEAYYYKDLYAYVKDSDLETGVLLAEIEKDSAADKAGLKSGDIVIGLNDNKITSVAYLRYYLYKHNAGDTITIKYSRDGEIKEVNVKLTAREN
jgi:serine protease Do